MAMYIMTRYRTLSGVSAYARGGTKGNILDCRCNESKRDDLKPGVSNRDSLKQSDKYPSPCRNSLDSGIPDIKRQKTDPVNQAVTDQQKSASGLRGLS